MTPEEIRKFKKEVADPVMAQRFAEIAIADGTCYVDQLKMKYLDGRSWGVDCFFKATGLICRDGKIEAFSHEARDVPFDVFLEPMKGCQFLAEAQVEIDDDFNECHLDVTLRSVDVFDGI